MSSSIHSGEGPAVTARIPRLRRWSRISREEYALSARTVSGLSRTNTSEPWWLGSLKAALAGGLRVFFTSMYGLTAEAAVARDADKFECPVQAVEYREQGYSLTQERIDTSLGALTTASAKTLAEAALSSGQPPGSPRYGPFRASPGFGHERMPTCTAPARPHSHAAARVRCLLRHRNAHAHRRSTSSPPL
ncbi:hypothetical protein [Streptomyces sp. NPDC052042]|uniref:hypothetical protein n=1 Tax=Streptomyces sp. NPDC052042 TaxID=3365683 RepID=UPI0037D75229